MFLSTINKNAFMQISQAGKVKNLQLLCQLQSEFIINLMEAYDDTKSTDPGIMQKSRRLLGYIQDIQKFTGGNKKQEPKKIGREISE